MTVYTVEVTYHFRGIQAYPPRPTKPTKFGPFKERANAEQCVLNLSACPDVLSAEITDFELGADKHLLLRDIYPLPTDIAPFLAIDGKRVTVAGRECLLKLDEVRADQFPETRAYTINLRFVPLSDVERGLKWEPKG